jgi:hypothetical protein
VSGASNRTVTLTVSAHAVFGASATFWISRCGPPGDHTDRAT